MSTGKAKELAREALKCNGFVGDVAEYAVNLALAAAIKVCDETAQTYPATSAETELSEAQVCAAAIREMMDSGRPA